MIFPFRLKKKLTDFKIMELFNNEFEGANVFEQLPEMDIEKFVDYRHHILTGFDMYEKTSAAFKITSSKVDFTTRKGTEVSVLL